MYRIITRLCRSKILTSCFISTFITSLYGEIQHGIDTTYRFMLHENLKEKAETYVRYRGFQFIVMPGVVSPKCFPDIYFYADTLPLHPGQSFLEIGSGIGLISVMAAIRCASYVAAVDSNPIAATNTMRNAIRHHVAHKTRVYEGDCFSALPCGEKFDVIFCHPPYLTTNLNKELLTPLEQTIYDPQSQMLRRCLEEAQNYLSPTGNLFLGFMSTGGNQEMLKTLISDNEWVWRVIAEKEITIPRLPGNCGVNSITLLLIQLAPKQICVY